MRVLSLFSGVGLGDYGLECAGMEIVGQVEIDDYCQKILALRWPEVPKWRDIKTLDTKELPPVDLVAGGFSCQPFSVAGKRRGKEDDRNLWPQMLRVIREVSPAWVIAENVPGIISSYLDQVLSDLEGAGYETVSIVFPAHALGAPHRRDRLWIVGHADGSGRGEQRRAESIQASFDSVKCDGQDMADSEGERRRRRNLPNDSRNSPANKQNRKESRSEVIQYLRKWKSEPSVGRVADVCPNRVDRLKALGNGQVVMCAEWIGTQVLKMVDQSE